MSKVVSVMIVALIAAIIETGTITPIIAHDIMGASKSPNGVCPPFFVSFSIGLGKHPDHNFNGRVCNLSLTIDDRDRRWILDDFILFNSKEKGS